MFENLCLRIYVCENLLNDNSIFIAKTLKIDLIITNHL
jgi:hypothetical protein